MLVLVLTLVGGAGDAGGDDVVAEVSVVLLVVLMWVVVLLGNTDAFCQWGLDQTMESTAAAAWTTVRQLQVLVAAWWRVDNVLLSAAAWIVLASDLCAARTEAFDWVSWLPSAPPVW